jgi:ribosomal protein S18 acetylase RimI-like enzyme
VTTSELVIQPVERQAFPRLWAIIEPVIREGATYPLPPTLGAGEAEAYWFAPGNHVFAAASGDDIIGTYYLRANQRGGGGHVANAGFMTAPALRGRGIARAMAAHAFAKAIELGFDAMQFNFVISSNTRAVRLWRSLDFVIVGVLPDAFRLPDGKPVDVFVMYRRLSPLQPQP